MHVEGPVDLIQRCRAGDQEAFAALYHQYANLVYKTAYLLLGDAQAAEDALQEVFLKVYRSLDGFDPEKGAFTTWLRRVTVNHCLNARRQRRFRLFCWEDRGAQAPSAAVGQMVSPEELALERENAQEVWAAVQRLSLPLRAALVLRYGESLSYQEIAQVLDVPLGTAKWRVHQALEDLRKELHRSSEARVPRHSQPGQEEASP